MRAISKAQTDSYPFFINHLSFPFISIARLLYVNKLQVISKAIIVNNKVCKILPHSTWITPGDQRAQFRGCPGCVRSAACRLNWENQLAFIVSLVLRLLLWVWAIKI